MHNEINDDSCADQHKLARGPRIRPQLDVYREPGARQRVPAGAQHARLPADGLGLLVLVLVREHERSDGRYCEPTVRARRRLARAPARPHRLH